MSLEPKLESSKEILEKAIADHDPYAKVLLFSGGGDSMTAYQVCKALGIQIDYVLHVNTRTGIKETTEFVRKFCEDEGVRYIEADAGSKYKDYVLRKGFFGVGTGKYSAHSFAFHILKRDPYEAAISRHIRQRKRGRKILLLNGARISESRNRAENLANLEIKVEKRKQNDVWVNVIHHWDKPDCKAFCGEQKCPKNPVSELLCRSGECMCGTVQGANARQEASYWFPEWGRWLDELESEVKNNFPWGWGESIPKNWSLEKNGQLNLFEQMPDPDFQPLCSSCLSQKPD